MYVFTGKSTKKKMVEATLSKINSNSSKIIGLIINNKRDEYIHTVFRINSYDDCFVLRT